MLKKIAFVIALFSSTMVFSQINFGGTNTKDHWRIGGNIGLNFGDNGYFGFAVAPMVAYDFNRYLEGGVTAGYQYSKWSHSKQHLFNFGPFLNFFPMSNIFIRTHYEYYIGSRKYSGSIPSRHFSENVLWLGAGYSSGRGPVRFYIGLEYDVLYDSHHSLFSNGFRPIGGVSIQI